MENNNIQDHSNAGISVKSGKLMDNCKPSSTHISNGYRFFDQQRTIYQIIGGGKAADVILLKQHQSSIGVIVVATVAWLLFEQSGLSFLTISSDILLILIIIQFIREKSAVMLNTQLKPLPELVLSEEMVNTVAASLRVKVNNMLLIAHDITIGNDFKLFFQMVVLLWLLSVLGSFFSFFTFAYIGTVISITGPAIYNKYKVHVDRCAGLVHQKLSKQYKIVDENVIQRLPRQFSKNKDA